MCQMNWFLNSPCCCSYRCLKGASKGSYLISSGRSSHISTLPGVRSLQDTIEYRLPRFSFLPNTLILWNISFILIVWLFYFFYTVLESFSIFFTGSHLLFIASKTTLSKVLLFRVWKYITRPYSDQLNSKIFVLVWVFCRKLYVYTLKVDTSYQNL